MISREPLQAMKGFMKKAEVLIVEDNGGDRFWLEYALQNLGASCTLSTVSDGEQAIDFLLKRGPYAESPTPDIIFLDVHLPKLDGIEVLRQVPNANELPLCVITSSEAERDIFRKEFGIEDSNYVLKPVTQESLLASACCHEHLKPLGG
jgi:two-component system response regulator